MKAVGLSIGIAVAHYLVSFVLLLFAAGAALGRLDQGGDPTAMEGVAGSVLGILLSPLVTFAPNGVSGVGGHVLFGLNSVLWGGVLGGVVLLAKSRKR